MNQHRTGPTTPRLTHRAITPGDADAFFALNSHPEVMRHTGEPPLESVEQARDALADYPDFDTHGYGRWGCFLRHDDPDTGAKAGDMIGFCGLKFLDELDEVDVGYRFLPEHWGRGYATEAGRASLAFGFGTLGLDRIIALVLPENLGSIRVIEKLGMSLAGRCDCEGLDALRYEIRHPTRRAR
jgi:ribosomal-protein-alanine N-acetyltransferase